jgi:hypothetical protein
MDKNYVFDIGVCGRMILKRISNMDPFYLAQNVTQCLAAVYATVNIVALQNFGFID